MANGDIRLIVKRLAVDVLMTVIFLALAAFAVWLMYIYFLRGPIDIETRGFVSRTVHTDDIQSVQTEKYKISHFHNMDDVVLAGIQSKSLCVKCHGDYPHEEEKKTRAFFNAHSWFMACEVCHMKPEKNEQVNYRWLEPDTGKELTSLNGYAGVYGGLIIPLKVVSGIEQRLDILSDKDQAFTEEFISQSKNVKADQNFIPVKSSQERIHKSLSKKAAFCDDCHTRNGLLNFNQLLYLPKRASHLESLHMASMVTKYEKFHMPKLFDKKIVHPD